MGSAVNYMKSFALKAGSVVAGSVAKRRNKNMAREYEQMRQNGQNPGIHAIDISDKSPIDFFHLPLMCQNHFLVTS